MDEAEALRRLGRARVGRMATVTAGGAPHVVPVVFALEDRILYWVVDRKPKRSQDLRRLENLRANPSVEVVVDHYEEDWTALWWVRARGAARILPEGPERERALQLLTAKYEQYREEPPEGAVIAIELIDVRSWEATPAG